MNQNLKNFLQSHNVQVSKIQKVIKSNLDKLHQPNYQRYFEAIQISKELAKTLKKESKLPNDFNISNGAVQIGKKEDLDPKGFQKLKAGLKKMLPWRKGPFELFGESIDAEWRSDQKWERLKKHLGPLQGRKILDVGCNNGYYLYLMAKQNPRFVLGIDPVIPYYSQFQFISEFHKPENIEFGLFGLEELCHFEKVFDAIFCMGILYHHPDPIGILRNIFQALRPGGLLIVESQGIQMDGPYFLFPRSRYTNMPGHWFLPSQEALENLLRRSGFQYIETFYKTKLEAAEQRKTTYAPYETLSDGLDETNRNLTIEGYPAPWRFYVKARRARIRK